jgi:hypothetical protein
VLLNRALAMRSNLLDLAAESIGPLQDAVDLGEETEAEASQLREWKRYRVSLGRLIDRPEWPNVIQWPEPPVVS